MGKYESVKKRPAIKEDRAKYQGVTTGRKKVKIGDSIVTGKQIGRAHV